MKPEYVHLAPGASPPTLNKQDCCAVIIADVSVGTEWREEIARWFVESGALYVVSWGVECEQWHDAVDGANLEEFAYGTIPDERFVMTTWHANEPLAEAMWFAGRCAFHPSVDLVGMWLIHIAETADAATITFAFAESQGSTADD